MPVHFGGMSDPFLIPYKFRYITSAILRILDLHNYPTLISTKADLSECKEFSDVIRGKHHFAFQISFSTFDNEIAALVEPNAPSPKQRIAGAQWAIKKGNWVACRLQPYIPYQKIDELVSFVKSCGFSHLTIEHLKLPFDKKIDIKILNSAFDLDILKLFPKKTRIKRGREFEMPNELRFLEIKKFLSACRKYNLSLGIGDNGFQHYSTSPCCCGIDVLPAFQAWFKQNVTVAIFRSRKDGKIEYSSIAKEWAPSGNIARMINSNTRLKLKNNTVHNHIKTQWLTNGKLSPSLFHNITTVKQDDGYEYYFDKKA
jgi:DNA repair photolyase